MLRVLWKVVGWFCLGLPSAAGSIDGELRSRSRMGRGTALVDGRPPMASSRRCVFFDSFQSLWAMGFFLLKVMPGVFFGGGGRRRGRRVPAACSGSRDYSVIFIFYWVLSAVQLGQLFLYPPRASLYLYAYLYAFLT